MSQQINLLVKKRAEFTPLLVGLGVLAIVLAATLGQWALGLKQAKAAREAAEASIQQLQQAQAQLQARIQQPANESPESIETLRQRAQAAQQLLAKVDELGTKEGHARYLAALAVIRQPDLWLTDVTISNGGKKVVVGGKALHQEAVTRYAQQLNAAFEVFGVQFTVLEVTPEPPVAGASQPGAVSFKLY